MRAAFLAPAPATPRRRHGSSAVYCATSPPAPAPAPAPAPPPAPRAPVVILPGLGNSARDYEELAATLRARGHAVAVPEIARWNWLYNVRGVATRAYWEGRLEPARVLGWYLDAVDAAVARVLEELGDGDGDGSDSVGAKGDVCIVGHSAGGWLGRVYASEGELVVKSGVRVVCLVTLGSPNVAPLLGAVDQTRGLLSYVERSCRAAGRVVCVAGRGVVGRSFGKGSVQELVAYLSYRAVCGQGDVEGDGVTPVQAAMVPGDHVERVVLDACGHTMLTGGNWYGSDEVVDAWARLLP